MVMSRQNAVACTNIEEYRRVFEIIAVSVLLFLLQNIRGQGVVVFGNSQPIHFDSASITYMGKGRLLHDLTPLWAGAPFAPMDTCKTRIV